MGLLDYYRQFDDMDQEEVNKRLREKRRLEKEKELQVVVNLDLATHRVARLSRTPRS